MLRSFHSLILALLMLGLASCVKGGRVDGDATQPPPSVASEAAPDGRTDSQDLAAAEGAPEGTTARMVPAAAPEGTLDPQHIAEVVQQRRSEFRACFETGLRQNPTLEGKVVYRFVVASSGEVERVDVEETTLGSSAVLKCMSGFIQSLRFDPPEGGGSVVVRYPFHFRAG